MDWKVEIKYDENRKNPIIEVKPWGVLVILPSRLKEDIVDSLLKKHMNWITKRYLEIQEALEKSHEVKLMERDYDEFKRLVKKLVDEATEEVLGVNPCRIVIRKMKTRWASYSRKGTLTINYFAKYLPEHLLSYIIYHEICHAIEPRHNKRFWEYVKRKYPEYKELEKELLAYEIKLGLLG